LAPPCRLPYITSSSRKTATLCASTPPKSRKGNPTLKAQGINNRCRTNHFRLSSRGCAITAFALVAHAVISLDRCLLTVGVENRSNRNVQQPNNHKHHSTAHHASRGSTSVWNDARRSGWFRDRCGRRRRRHVLCTRWWREVSSCSERRRRCCPRSSTVRRRRRRGVGAGLNNGGTGAGAVRRRYVCSHRNCARGRWCSHRYRRGGY
jgi:hypothetical protein